MASQTRRRGRPPGSRAIPSEMIIRLPVHLTIHHQRHPLLAVWLAEREPRRLAGDVVELMERALAGGNVAPAPSRAGGDSKVYEIDMSGLMEWD
jgi:hypothetical protein